MSTYFENSTEESFTSKHDIKILSENEETVDVIYIPSDEEMIPYIKVVKKTTIPQKKTTAIEDVTSNKHTWKPICQAAASQKAEDVNSTNVKCKSQYPSSNKRTADHMESGSSKRFVDEKVSTLFQEIASSQSSSSPAKHRG